MATYSYTYTPIIKGGYVFGKSLYNADTVKYYTVFQTRLTTSENLTDGAHNTRVGLNDPDHKNHVYINFPINAEEAHITTAVLSDVPENATSITLKLCVDARYSKNKAWSSASASVRSYKNSNDPLSGGKDITVSKYVRSATISTTREDKVVLTYTGATKTAVYNALYSGAGKYPVILARITGSGSHEQDASTVFRVDCYEVWWEVSYTVPDITVKLKVNGAWQNGTLMTKVNGEWVNSSGGYVKVNGEWIQVE